jgi:hypothetical protein
MEHAGYLILKSIILKINLAPSIQATRHNPQHSNLQTTVCSCHQQLTVHICLCFPIKRCVVMAKLEGSILIYRLRYRVAILTFTWFSSGSFPFIYVLHNDIVSNAKKYRAQLIQFWLNILVKTDIQEDSHCTYNITLRGVRATIAVVEGRKYYIFWLCVCSITYPALNTHAPYYFVICDLSGFTIFLHFIS